MIAPGRDYTLYEDAARRPRMPARTWARTATCVLAAVAFIAATWAIPVGLALAVAAPNGLPGALLFLGGCAIVAAFLARTYLESSQ